MASVIRFARNADASLRLGDHPSLALLYVLSAASLPGDLSDGKRLSGNLIGYVKSAFSNITKLNWSQEAMVKLLGTGITDDGDQGGALLQVVRSTSQLSPEDHATIAAYVVSLPPIVSVAVSAAPHPW